MPDPITKATLSLDNICPLKGVSEIISYLHLEIFKVEKLEKSAFSGFIIFGLTCKLLNQMWEKKVSK